MENGQEAASLDIGEKGLVEILSLVVKEVRDSVGRDINGADLLYSLLNTPWLQSLLKVYECLQKHLRSPASPQLSYASGLSLEIVSDLRALEHPSYEARELYSLLTSPHIQALLSAHDVVGLKDYEPALPPLPEELPDDEEAIRIVCLVKNNQPLGATIRRHEMTGEIYIARVIHGGLAERSDLLHAGDRVVEVNGCPVFGLEPEQIIQILIQSSGTVMFKVVPIIDRPINNKTMLFVRAMVDYSPKQDPGIPCVDAGMTFRKGDILEIVDQTDSLWWQSKKLPCSSDCASLIPSTCLLKRKRDFWLSPHYQSHICIKTLGEDDILAIEMSLVEKDDEAFESEEFKEEESDFSTSAEGTYMAGFRRSLRVSRRQRTRCGCSGQIYLPHCSNSDISPYEEVVRYKRQPLETHRLIALLGPSGVGVNELRRKLIEINPKTYQGATPHTTRSCKLHEKPGREYHFISTEEFKNMMYNHRFLEYGEYRGHLYGTSVEAVKEVLAAGKICIIDIDPHAIDSVRTHELRAYIIYIKPPPLDQMKRTRMNAQILTNYCTTRPFQEEDFHEIEEEGHGIEQRYGQFFDHVIVNDGLQASCVQLLKAVRRAQEEPQWVPASWIRPTDHL
ncbi:MAGUK p55 subfamily member 4 [Trichomycterus rosablanca]|uniref:MAGUK p55 subfamily member 4 n=1 Tax=Trichomycterus rosablanca TaxID=2290929 RepID=UPI002F35784B